MTCVSSLACQSFVPGVTENSTFFGKTLSLTLHIILSNMLSIVQAFYGFYVKLSVASGRSQGGRNACGDSVTFNDNNNNNN